MRRVCQLLTVVGVLAAALAVGVGGAGANDINVPSVGTHVTRTWNWTISKSAAQPVLTLAQNQAYGENYSVTVGTSGYTDSDPSVTGTMNVVYPNLSYLLIGVDGNVYQGPPESYTLTPFSLLGGDCVPPFPEPLTTITCNFDVAVPSEDPGFVGVNSNDCPVGVDCTADPSQLLVAKASSAPFDFSTAAATYRDGCVSVTDNLAGSLGSSCSTGAPTTYGYGGTIGPYPACGDYEVDNTASFTTNDTGATGSSTASVIVHVPCATGCTLTIGYWKNHAGFGPQADMVSALLPIGLGTAGGAKTINVTTPALAVQILGTTGSNGIHKLDAQLLGAKLSGADGADLSAVAGTVAAADAFLATHDSGDWKSLTKAQQQSVVNLAATLDSFNNGLIGPGHCSQ